MADFSALKTAIQANIRTNGNEEITGEILQDILLSMVTTMGDGAINALAEALAAEVAARQNAVSGEATTRAEADSQLSGRINAEAQARAEADTQLGNSITAITTRLNEGYVYAGIATPSTNPGTPAGKVFYIALHAGTYTNFSSLDVTKGINILKYNGTAWSQDNLLAIDNVPKKNGINMVTSGGIFANIGAFDISEYHKSDSTLATYADLTAALAALPSDFQKGGMSIKFVQSSDNKYVQYRLMANQWSTTVTDWQGVDDEPTAGSDNLVKSGGVYRNMSYGKNIQETISTNVWWYINFLAGKKVKCRISTTGNTSLNNLYTDDSFKRFFPINAEVYFDFSAASEVKILWNCSAVATLEWEVIRNDEVFPEILLVDSDQDAPIGKYYTINNSNIFVKNSVAEPHQIFPVNDNYTAFLSPKGNEFFIIGDDKCVWDGEKFINILTSQDTRRNVKVMERYGYISQTGYIVGLDSQSTGCYVTDVPIPVKKGDTIIYCGGYNQGPLYPIWGFSSLSQAGQKIGSHDFTGSLQCFIHTIDDDDIKYVAAFGKTDYFPSLTVIPANEAERLYDFIVAADGSGDCTSLHHVLQLAKVLESNKHVNVFIKSGSYEMPKTDNTTQIFRENRNISLIGEDKNSVVIYNNEGTYTSMQNDATPIKLSGNVTLKNLTIRSLSTSHSGEDTPSSYCVHVDFNVEAGSVMEIIDCDMYNDHFACVGAGLRDNFMLRIKNCNMYSEWPAQQNWNGAVVCHDGNQEGVGQKIELFDNIIQCTGWRAVAITQAYGKTIDATFIGNAMFSTGAEPYVFGAQTVVNMRTCLNNVIIPVS